MFKENFEMHLKENGTIKKMNLAEFGIENENEDEDRKNCFKVKILS